MARPSRFYIFLRVTGQFRRTIIHRGQLVAKYDRPIKGPSIYDVHTEGEGGSGSGGRMWTGEGVKPHVDVHTEN